MTCRVWRSGWLIGYNARMDQFTLKRLLGFITLIAIACWLCTRLFRAPEALNNDQGAKAALCIGLGATVGAIGGTLCDRPLKGTVLGLLFSAALTALALLFTSAVNL